MKRQMPGKMKAAAAALAAVLIFIFFAVPAPSKTVPPAAASAKAPRPTSIAAPDAKAYAGAYIDFGENEDDVTLERIEHFDELVGKQQAIVALANDWGRLSFPAKQVRIIEAYGAAPLLYWLPWDRPSETPVKENRFDLNKMLAGEWNSYIDQWGRDAAAFGRPLFVSWGLEMNGNWFPWSGVFYGGGEREGNGFKGPELYKRAYRYVVERVKAAGATNIIWVFHANNRSDPEQPWNELKSYYPGDDVADWLGLSAYGQQYPHIGWAPFQEVLPRPYKALAELNPTKPIMLAEWGIGEFPKSGSKAAWIDEFFRRTPAEFDRLRAAVFWHERWQNGDLTYSNLRVNSSPESLRAYKKGVAGSFWLPRPVYK